MDLITQLLFKVSNSLLIPNIIALLVMFVYSLIMLGSFYNAYMVKRRTDKELSFISQLRGTELRQLSQRLPEGNISLVGRYLEELFCRDGLDDDYLNFLLSSYEAEASKDLNTSKLFAKVGPILGLIGTLISMSPALVGLSTGDIEAMAYNMQIVFATTVVGLVISLIGLITQQYKQRWYAEGLSVLEYVGSQLLSSTHESESEAKQA